MTAALCRACDAYPSPNHLICDHCLAQAADDLAEIADHSTHLDDTRAKRGAIRYDGSTVTGSKAYGLTYDPHVTPVVKQTKRALIETAVLLDTLGVKPPHMSTLAMLACWLREHLHELRDHDNTPTHLNAIHAAREAIEKLVDRKPDQAYIGPCNAENEDGQACGADVYVQADHAGKPTATLARCPRCHAEYDVAERREWLIGAAEDHLVTFAELAGLMAGVAGRGTLQRLIESGNLTARTTITIKTRAGEDRQANVYRVGDARQALARRDADHTKKVAKTA